MKNLKYFCIAFLTILLIAGCEDNSTSSNTKQYEEASPLKKFVWNAMNYWYYWQDDVPELGNSYFSSDQEFNEYLNNFSDAEAVFNALQYQADDFSFFIDNYETFQQSQQGISESFGYEFGLIRENSNSNEIFGYVQYILPDSPAQDAGLVRGDLFTKVDGTQLTVSNYSDLLQGTTSYQLTLAELQDNSITETGETVDLQAVTLQENPIFMNKILEESNTKIGYLLYNAFQLNSHEELNEIFGTFSSQGINELVVDLRYNSGGTGITAQMLAGMISGLDDSNDFATYSYNSKRAPNWNRTVSILNEVPVYENEEKQEDIPMNQLSLDHVYFLVDYSTASASELLVNALRPYMNIKLIGTQTTGKDEGSYTLYDAPNAQYPFLVKENANPDHKFAIQPIVLKLVNANGEAYPNGFTPDTENQVNERNYLEDLPPLGDKSDPLLARALELITGQQQPAKLTTPVFKGELMKDSRDLKPYAKRLTLQPPIQQEK